MVVLVALILAGLAASPETETETSTSGATRSATTAAFGGLIPPKPLAPLVIDYPSDFPPIEREAVVTVKIRVDETGEVANVDLTHGAGEPFDALVIEAARKFRFSPATYFGRPVPVDINFTQRFQPPAPVLEQPGGSAAPSGPARTALLAGKLREKGTRRPIAFAAITAHLEGRDYETSSDEEGKFELALPPGKATVVVIAAGHHRFVQNELLKKDERLEIGYLIESERYDPYEVVVTAKKERTEVARTSLRGRDIAQVPGTFGDPFRVIATLPGVTSIMSLLPFPVVRGSSPGNTGFLIDGVRVPLLFHLLAGPSVIHPEFIEEIEFSPGGFPVEYGGYTGGIVDGKTRAARRDEHRIDADLNLFQVGGMVREPISFLGGTATFAGRYGYPGLMVSMASPRITLSYWDYQARFDGGTPSSGYTIFVFGAEDLLDSVPQGQPDDAPKEPLLHFDFHRLDLRYHHRSEGIEGNYQLTLGYDSSLSPDATLSGLSATPRARLELAAMPELTLRFGIDGLAKQADFTEGPNGAGTIRQLLGANGDPSNTLYSGGALVEALYRPVERLLVRPGVRVDLYTDTKSTHAGVDPRVLARYRVLDEGPELWLKSSVGLYHQPPRFTIPIPGLDEIAFKQGLLESIQAMVGADVKLADEWSVDAQTYFNYMDPILYDTQINPSVDQVQMLGPQAPPGEMPPTPPKNTSSIEGRLDQLLAPAKGRSFGLELLVRRESRTGVSGWISYTLSRSERRRDGSWVGFDFDRTHIMNLVVGVPLPRRWQIGMRAQVQSGRPLTTTTGLASARTSAFVRFDLRVDKTAVWNDWLLDFYVDITNVVLGAEELAPANEVRYVLPTVGFRAIF